MAGHPLRPATHRCLGEPLPHQLANGTRAHLRAVASKERPPFPARSEDLVVLSGISSSFPGLSQARRQITHALLTRAPLYRPPEGDFLVRLACLKHSASVRSEPESNSPVQIRPRPRECEPTRTRCAYDAHFTEVNSSITDQGSKTQFASPSLPDLLGKTARYSVFKERAKL